MYYALYYMIIILYTNIYIYIYIYIQRKQVLVTLYSTTAQFLHECFISLFLLELSSIATLSPATERVVSVAFIHRTAQA